MVERVNVWLPAERLWTVVVVCQIGDDLILGYRGYMELS